MSQLYMVDKIKSETNVEWLGTA